MNIIFSSISIFSGMAGTKRLNNFATNLKKRNITINNLIFKKKTIKQELKLKGEKNGIVFLNIQYSLFNIFSIIIFYFKGFKFIKNQYIKSKKNIYYNYGYPNIRNVPLIIWAKILGYKILFDIVEDNFSIKHFKSLAAKIKNFSSQFFFKRIFWLANGAIAISTYLENQLIKISKGKFSVINIPISILKKNFNIETPLKEHNVEVKIFYGGSFGEKDGLKYLLEAFERVADQFPESKLILTGKGSKSDMELFFKELKCLKNKNKIECLGYVDENKYYRIINSVDMHCMTRINTPFANAGFPFKLGEMLASGKPVIVSKVGDIPVVIKQNEAILIEPESVEELVRAISYLINNKKEAYEIGNKGKKLAYKLFDADILSKQLYNFLLKI